MLANAAFGEGAADSRIWMSGLTCGTTQLSLFSCSSTSSIGSVPASCRHTDDASVRCQGLATSNYRISHSNTLDMPKPMYMLEPTKEQ